MSDDSHDDGILETEGTAENSFSSKSKAHSPLYITVIVLLVLTLSGLGIAKFRGDDADGSTDGASLSPSTSGQTVGVKLPSWYAPRSLNVVTVTYQSLSGAGKTTDANIVVDFSPESNITQGIGAQVLNITDGYAETFYDTKTGKTFYLRQAILDAMGLEKADISVNEYGVNPDFALYTVNDDKSYLYSVRTCEVKPLSCSLYGISMGVSVTDDYRYIAFSRTREGDNRDDVYLIDTAAMSCKTVSRDYKASTDSRISPKGNFVFFSVWDDNGKTADNQNRVFYNTRTGGYFKQTGDLIRFSEKEDSALMIKDGKYKLIDTASGKEIPDKMSVKGTDRYYVDARVAAVASNDTVVVRADIADGSEKTLTAAPVNAYCLSKNNRYLYTYNGGDAFIRFTDTVTLKSAEVPVDSAFVSQTADLKQTHSIRYSLYIDDTMTRALLCYFIMPLKNIEKDPDGIPDQTTEEDNMTYTEEHWDIRAHTALQTAEHFENFYLMPYEPHYYNPDNIGQDLKKDENLRDLINILRSQKYSDAGRVVFSESNRVFGFSADSPAAFGIYIVEIGITDSGKYYIYDQEVNIYCYISKTTFEQIRTLCGQMITLKTEPDVKPEIERPEIKPWTGDGAISTS